MLDLLFVFDLGCRAYSLHKNDWLLFIDLDQGFVNLVVALAKPFGSCSHDEMGMFTITHLDKWLSV